MRRNGLRQVIGSWKIIAIWLPRSARMRASRIASTFSPPKRTPPVMRPGGWGMSRMSAIEETLFPHPDSPTIPRVCPPSRA